MIHPVRAALAAAALAGAVAGCGGGDEPPEPAVLHVVAQTGGADGEVASAMAQGARDAVRAAAGRAGATPVEVEVTRLRPPDRPLPVAEQPGATVPQRPPSGPRAPRPGVVAAETVQALRDPRALALLVAPAAAQAAVQLPVAADAGVPPLLAATTFPGFLRRVGRTDPSRYLPVPTSGLVRTAPDDLAQGTAIARALRCERPLLVRVPGERFVEPLVRATATQLRREGRAATIVAASPATRRALRRARCATVLTASPLAAASLLFGDAGRRVRWVLPSALATPSVARGAPRGTRVVVPAAAAAEPTSWPRRSAADATRRVLAALRTVGDLDRPAIRGELARAGSTDGRRSAVVTLLSR